MTAFVHAEQMCSLAKMVIHMRILGFISRAHFWFKCAYVFRLNAIKELHFSLCRLFWCLFRPGCIRVILTKGEIHRGFDCFRCCGVFFFFQALISESQNMTTTVMPCYYFILCAINVSPREPLLLILYKNIISVNFKTTSVPLAIS